MTPAELDEAERHARVFLDASEGPEDPQLDAWVLPMLALVAEVRRLRAGRNEVIRERNHLRRKLGEADLELLTLRASCPTTTSSDS